jgi:hypothetical protein
MTLRDWQNNWCCYDSGCYYDGIDQGIVKGFTIIRYVIGTLPRAKVAQVIVNEVLRILFATVFCD